MNANPSEHYVNVFFSSKTIELMERELILQPGGSPDTLMVNLIARLARAEKQLGEAHRNTDSVLAAFYDFTRRGLCTLGSPLLTNIAAGRQTLGSCSAVPIDVGALSASDLDLAEAYYNLNMGSGYDLTDSPDPCDTLLRLNRHATRVENSGSCERYVGNIAHLSVHHPRVLEFIEVKRGREDIVHFNISVDVTKEFMRALFAGAYVRMSDGTELASRDIWDAIVAGAWECGDPGIIALERYNQGNALRAHAPYVTTAPCAEVGLSPGETCVFAYINLAACLRATPRLGVDLELVGDVAACLTRVLDDAVEANLNAFPTAASTSVVAAKRKIGIGLCGLADALLWLGVPYASPESARLLADVLATLNYRSKEASLQLAERRGPFLSFHLSEYQHNTDFLSRFGKVESVIGPSTWNALAKKVSRHGLRNVMTTALPPSGRSALLLGVNPSIEPYLSFRDDNDFVMPVQMLLSTGQVRLADNLGKIADNGAGRPEDVFRTAAEIAPEEHLSLLRIAAGVVDDGVSKTINLPPHATPESISDIFQAAWDAGLKAISVYRVGSRNPQVS